jgi:hypothetical protein
LVLVAVNFAHRSKYHNNWCPPWGNQGKPLIEHHGYKWDIEKFTGGTDFGLWKANMREFFSKTLSGEALMSARLTLEEKTEMNNKKISVIILCLGDKVLREVAKKTNVVMII